MLHIYYLIIWCMLAEGMRVNGLPLLFAVLEYAWQQELEVVKNMCSSPGKGYRISFKILRMGSWCSFGIQIL